MICSNCGAENENNAKFCRGCGFPIVPESERQQYGPGSQYGMTGPAPYRPPNQYSAASIVGLIMGIVSVVFCFTGILGIGCGVTAICLGATQKGKDRKNAMATAALVLGIVGVALTVVLFTVLIATGFFASLSNGINRGYDWGNYPSFYDAFS